MDKKIFVFGLAQFALAMIETTLDTGYNQERFKIAQMALGNFFECNALSANQSSDAAMFLRDAVRDLDSGTPEWHFGWTAVFCFDWNCRAEDAPGNRDKQDALERCIEHHTKAIGLVADSVPSHVN